MSKLEQMVADMIEKTFAKMMPQLAAAKAPVATPVKAPTVVRSFKSAHRAQMTHTAATVASPKRVIGTVATPAAKPVAAKKTRKPGDAELTDQQKLIRAENVKLNDDEVIAALESISLPARCFIKRQWNGKQDHCWVHVYFDAKPDASVRVQLKLLGFGFAKFDAVGNNPHWRHECGRPYFGRKSATRPVLQDVK